MIEVGRLPFPLEGSTLIVGPSNVGKTRLTARALERWLARHGPSGVVVLDFGPDIEHGGRRLGGRLTRFTDVPEEAWYGVLAAHAPRAQAADPDGALELARDNAERATQLVEAAPDHPRLVVVNDATIPFQHELGDLHRFLAYLDRAACVVCNAFQGEELGVGDPVSRHERWTLATLRSWADRTVELDDGSKSA